jgi:hypothetical protein
VRHADDHIHVTATLVRQDGRTVWPRHDYRRCHRVARQIERRLGLHPLSVSGVAGMAGV